MITPPKLEIRELSLADIDSIEESEKRSWIRPLRASRRVIGLRFRLNQIFLGALSYGRLIGKICFSYSHFSPDNIDGFPKTFEEFSTQVISPEYNAAFVYNLDVEEWYRQFGLAKLLIGAMIERAKSDGCRYVVVDGRPASYNGSRREKIAQNPNFARSINQYLWRQYWTGEKFPDDRELCQDPLLRFYHEFGGHFLWIIKDFLPRDEAAGGMRVIMYKEI